MDLFTAAPHHDVLIVLIQITVLLLTARGLGEIARRLNQPTVVGEILAGILLGPSLLSGLFPALREWFVPQNPVQGYLLEIIGMLGGMLLLLLTGLEMDLALIRRHTQTAIGASIGGIVLPFVTGFLLGQLLPESLRGSSEDHLVFSLFLATAMSISAIPVLAKVLMDLNLMRRNIGQIVIAAGMNDDTIGWILLSAVVGLASGEVVTVGSVLAIIGRVLGFMIISFTLGRWLVRRALLFVNEHITSRDKFLTLVIILTFGWGAITQGLELEAVLGAFIMGILLGQSSELPQEVHHKLESMAMAVFTPIFFGIAGLKVNILNLLNPQLLLFTLLVILIATGGKVIGTYVGARLIGNSDHWTALCYGIGLNARGAMGIIVATIGLSLGILNQDIFSIIVVMAIATSLMTPPALRWAFKRVKPDPEEVRRLEQEELANKSLVAGIQQVLLPIRQRPFEANSKQERIEAYILEKLAIHKDLQLTLLTITPAGTRPAAIEFQNELEASFKQKRLTKKVVEGNYPAGAILTELKKRYDLLMLGASEKETAGPDVLFTPMVDHLVRHSPIPALIISGRPDMTNWPPKRILLPTAGTLAAKNAVELGFALAADKSAELYIVNVVIHDTSNYELDASGKLFERQLTIAHQIVNELRRLGDMQGLTVHTDVEIGPDVESVIWDYTHREQIDLIILGTDLRVDSDRLFLGPRVERILKTATCPVIIFNS